MSLLLEKLLNASFRGIKFFVEDLSTTSGQKTITHEYPDSDRRFVESLGKFSPTYSFTAIVSGSGDEYFKNRNDLINALDQPGVGLLSHPFYGNQNVVAKAYTVRENMRELGIAFFSLQFEVSGENLFPITSEKFSGEIEHSAEMALTDTNNAFVSAYKKLTDKFSVLRANKVVDKMIGIFKDVRSNFSPVITTVQNFDSLLQKFVQYKYKLVSDVTALPISILQLFGTIETIGTNADQLFNIFGNFFEFTSNVQKLTPETPTRKLRNDNDESLVDLINMGALIYAYKTIPLKTYSTILDVNDSFQILENQFEFLSNRIFFSQENLQNLKNLRNQVKGFLDGEKLNIYDIVEIDTTDIPIRALTYQYYGSTDNTDLLTDLNEINIPSHIEGNINIFSYVG